MNKPINIVGIAGSLRRESYNRAALRAAKQLVERTKPNNPFFPRQR